MINETRLITVDELYHVKTIFKHDNKIEKRELTEEQVDRLIVHLKDGMDLGTTVITMSFEDGEPVIMYVGYAFDKLSSWYIGLVKTIKTNMHFKNSAKLMAPAYDLMVGHFTQLGYYKGLMTASERNHNIRNFIMSKYSTWLNRYDWYDEFVILPGEKTGVACYDANRLSVSEEVYIVREFFLKQEFRLEYILKNTGNQ